MDKSEQLSEANQPDKAESSKQPDVRWIEVIDDRPPIAKRRKPEPPKFYAVKGGRAPGVFRTWVEARQQWVDMPKAELKVFDTKEEANEFAGVDDPSTKLRSEWVATSKDPFSFWVDRSADETGGGVFVGTVVSDSDVDRLVKTILTSTANVDVYKLGKNFIVYYGTIVPHTRQLDANCENFSVQNISLIPGVRHPQVGIIKKLANSETMEKIRDCLSGFDGNSLPWGVYLYGFSEDDDEVYVYPVL